MVDSADAGLVEVSSDTRCPISHTYIPESPVIKAWRQHLVNRKFPMVLYPSYTNTLGNMVGQYIGLYSSYSC